MNQSINCKVSECQYHDQAHRCTLSDITVGNSAPSPTTKSETECASFMKG